jgi:hypothetical protein
VKPTKKNMDQPKNENKSREPIPQVNTPTPPQVMDTRMPPDQNEKKPGKKTPSPKNESKERPKDQEPEKKKLLGESPLEIDDETTI